MMVSVNRLSWVGFLSVLALGNMIRAEAAICENKNGITQNAAT